MQDGRDMEKNYINYQGQTYFYVNVKKKTYGIVVSQKDSKNKEWEEGVA